MCDRMLQDSLRCYRETGCGVGWGFGPRARGGDSAPARGVRGFGPGRGMGGFGPRVRGGRGFEPGRGVGWGFGPRARGSVGIRAGARGGDSGLGAGWGDSDSGRGVWIRAPGARWDGDSGPGRGVGIRPRRGVGIIWGKMGNFLPFCRFFAVWVGICISSRLCMILNITPTQQIRIPVKIIHIVI